MKLPYCCHADNATVRQDVTLVPEALSTITGPKECSKLWESGGDEEPPAIFLRHQ